MKSPRNFFLNCCRTKTESALACSRNDCPRGYHLSHRPTVHSFAAAAAASASLSCSRPPRWLQFSAARFSFDLCCMHAARRTSQVAAPSPTLMTSTPYVNVTYFLWSDPQNLLIDLVKPIMHVYKKKFLLLGHPTVSGAMSGCTVTSLVKYLLIF